MGFSNFFEILKYTLPSIIVFATAYYLIKSFMDNEYRKQMILLRKENQHQTLPMRFQAFERIVLLLDRIELKSIVIRVNKKGRSASQFQFDLIQIIKQEYEHNISQQVYVSSSGWDAVRHAKEETIKIINLASSQVDESHSAMDLAEKILMISGKLEKSPSRTAADIIKLEIRQLL